MVKSCNSANKNISFQNIINDKDIRAFQHKHRGLHYRGCYKAFPHSHEDRSKQDCCFTRLPSATHTSNPWDLHLRSSFWLLVQVLAFFWPLHLKKWYGDLWVVSNLTLRCSEFTGLSLQVANIKAKNVGRILSLNRMIFKILWKIDKIFPFYKLP